MLWTGRDNRLDSTGDAKVLGTELKSLDRERYLASLVVGEAAREPVQALYAFGAEAARVHELVSEPGPGEIRLQWWVDLLEGTEHGGAGGHPVAAPLLEIIDRFDLPTGPLRRLLAARRFDLYDDPMRDMESFEGYAGETNSVLYQFAAMVMNGGNDAGAADAAGHIGVAHALIGHLRALPVTASRAQIYLPWSVFAAHGVTEADLFGGVPSDGVQAATAQLREVAGQHLDLAKTAVEGLPRAVKPVFAPLTLLRHQLTRLNDYAHLPFVTPPDQLDWLKLGRLAWWVFREGK